MNKIKDKEEIRKNYKIGVVGIFGSYSRKEQKRKSDLDILVKLYKGATLFELLGLSIFLEENLNIKNVDAVPLSCIRKELKKFILKDAIYL